MKKKNLLLAAFALILAFSLVFAGCDGNGDGGGKKPDDPETDPGTVLKVTDIPTETNIIGIAILDSEMVPVAIGMWGEGEAELFEPGLGGFMPDSSKPWKASGDFAVTLRELKEGYSLTDLLDVNMAEEATEEYLYIGADVSALISIIAGIDFTAIDPTNPASFAALAPLMQYMELLLGLQARLPAYTFAEDEVVTIPWSNFLSRTILEQLEQLASLIPQMPM